MRVEFPLLLATFCLVAGWSSDHVTAQTTVRSADLSRAADGVNVVAEELDREEIAAADAWYDRHELALSVDGNLPGNLRVYDDNDKLIPARVKLYFLQSGKVVAQATPNDDGDFQAVGLQSGTYSLVAGGESGFAALGVRILPPPERPEPPKANTIGRIREVSLPGSGGSLHLNISMIKSNDVQAAMGIANATNAGNLASLPGLTGVGAATTGATGTTLGTLGSSIGVGGAAGAAGLSGAGGVMAFGAAGAGFASASGNNNSTGGSGTSSSGNNNNNTASPNGS